MPSKSKSHPTYTTAYAQFKRDKIAELKERNPDQPGIERIAEVNRLWKMDDSNPKKGTYTD